MDALADIAVGAGAPLVRVEANFGDGMFSRLLETHLRQKGFKGRVEDHKVTGMKETRIIGFLQPVLQNHRLVVDRAVIEQDLAGAKGSLGLGLGKFSYLEYSGLYQLTHMSGRRGALRKDDRVDVLANAVSYWLEYMALDSTKAEAAEERKANEEFAKIVARTQVNQALSGPKPGHEWGRNMTKLRQVRNGVPTARTIRAAMRARSRALGVR
jgi:hypothetical protein